MIARVARFAGQPERFTTGDYGWVLETIQTADGFEAAYHLLDETTGDSISISFFESEAAATSAEEQVAVARQRLDKQASPPDEVHLWRVVNQARR